MLTPEALWRGLTVKWKGSPAFLRSSWGARMAYVILSVLDLHSVNSYNLIWSRNVEMGWGGNSNNGKTCGLGGEEGPGVTPAVGFFLAPPFFSSPPRILSSSFSSSHPGAWAQSHPQIKLLIFWTYYQLLQGLGKSSNTTGPCFLHLWTQMLSDPMNSPYLPTWFGLLF